MCTQVQWSKRYINRNSWFFFLCLSYLDIVCTLFDKFFVILFVVLPFCLIDISIFPSVPFLRLMDFFIVCCPPLCCLIFGVIIFINKRTLFVCEQIHKIDGKHDHQITVIAIQIDADHVFSVDLNAFRLSVWNQISQCNTIEIMKNPPGSRFHSHPEFISVVACPFGICLLPSNSVLHQSYAYILTTISSWHISNGKHQF